MPGCAELVYHPERHADEKCPDPAARAAAQTKRQWIATPQTIENARMRCQAIRQANQDLQPCVERLRTQLLAERERLQAGSRAEAGALVASMPSACIRSARSEKLIRAATNPA